MKIKVDVITPFYYGNEYISFLGGVLEENACEMQSAFPGAELCWHIMNDSPGCSVKLKKEKWQYMQVWIHDFSENGGIHHARVEGLAEADGDFVLFLDQDDEISGDYLVKQLQNLKDGADLSVCNATLCEADGASHPFYQKNAELRETAILNVYLRVRNPIISPGQCLIRRNAIPEEWSSALMHKNGSDDLLLWVMMLAKKAKFVTQPECLYTHHYTGKNVSGSLKQITGSSMEVVEVLKRTKILNSHQLADLQHSVEWGGRTAAENRRYYHKNFRIFRTRLLRKVRFAFSGRLG